MIDTCTVVATPEVLIEIPTVIIYKCVSGTSSFLTSLEVFMNITKTFIYEFASDTPLKKALIDVYIS